MVRPLPVEGNAGVVLAISRGLGDQAARLIATTRALEGVSRTMAQDWDSPAGAAFAARAGAVLPVVSRIATRYAAAAAAVRPVAEALHAAQASSTEELAEWDDAWPRFLAASEAMAAAQGSADPGLQAQAAGHRAVMVAQRERCTRAERRNAAAHEQWRQADERCEVALRQLVRDGLADPWAYDALTATSREAGDEPRGAADGAGAHPEGGASPAQGSPHGAVQGRCPRGVRAPRARRTRPATAAPGPVDRTTPHVGGQCRLGHDPGRGARRRLRPQCVPRRLGAGQPQRPPGSAHPGGELDGRQGGRPACPRRGPGRGRARAVALRGRSSRRGAPRRGTPRPDSLTRPICRT